MQSIAVVCSVGEQDTASVTAFMSPHRVSAPFLHAIEMEREYSNTLLGFDDGNPPFYESTSVVDLQRVAREFGVDRVLCFVALDASNKVIGGRDYDGIEVTILEAATEQLTQFQDLLQSLATTASRRLQ